MIPSTLHLPHGATLVVIGGGPAGAFFAIRALRAARNLRRKLDLVILEKKKEHRAYPAVACPPCWEGCNYCAGGISPRLVELLREIGLTIPSEIVMGQAHSLTVHGEWKSIELAVPQDRQMLFVFRGSRPRQRYLRYENLDNFLLGHAIEEGARVVAGEVHDLRTGPGQRPAVVYRSVADTQRDVTLEADFVVVASGVNQTPGMDLVHSPFVRALQRAIPGFRPPSVRRSLIAEIHAGEHLRHMRDEVHFAQYGSKHLHIEMSSLIPKGQWMTITLLGRSIDQADPSQYHGIMERFLDLPYIRRLLPRGADLAPSCACHPNMTVGVARQPYGERIAVIGDLAVSRLYKDGILSAYATASALADCIVQAGVDRESLRLAYWPAVRAIYRDNRFGAIVFFLNRVTFSHPVLSRIAYQAVVTERKTRHAERRHLASVLWRIASGDDSYQRILLSMFHPASIRSIVVGGVLVTVRNVLAERLFGLDWEGFGRHPTGVCREEVEEKRRDLAERLGLSLAKSPQFERMYTIKVLAEPPAILRELGRFGDPDRRYFNPRLIRVRRTAGEPNAVGSTIHYDVVLKSLSFSIVLERVVESRYLVYRVRDGFARGGVLVFDIDRQEPGLCLLSIYVAFDFPREGSWLKRLAWRAFALVFPAFLHDVLWNHALCEIKHLVESGAEAFSPGCPSGPSAIPSHPPVAVRRASPASP